MAIKKKIKKIENTVGETVKPVVEEVVLKPTNNEVEEEIIEEDVFEEEVEEEAEEEAVPTTVKAKVPVKSTVNKTEKPVSTKKVVKEEKPTFKPTLSGKAPKSPSTANTVERKIGKVFPKDILYKNIQAELDKEFSEISLETVKKIFAVVESELCKAAQTASVRFLGGILKAQPRRISVNKSPKVDYYSYKGEGSVLKLTGAELGKPDQYRGKLKGNKFIVEAVYDYEQGKYVPAEGTIELPEE